MERSRNSLSCVSLISIGFHGGSDDMDQLQTTVLDEIRSLHVNGPGEDVVRSIKESMLKSHKQTEKNDPVTPDTAGRLAQEARLNCCTMPTARIEAVPRRADQREDRGVKADSRISRQILYFLS